MILENAVIKLTQQNNINGLILRNKIKEEIQHYVLHFVYNSSAYNDLIFTGGTCLKKLYGLNRLSEDLDFDYTGNFDITAFAEDIKTYFSAELQYKSLDIKVAPHKRSIFLKFKILKEIEFFKYGTPEDLFLRCDISPEKVGDYALVQKTIKAGSYEFFVNSYDLPTLFANKIAAFIERSFFKGEFQKIPFKGRDVYDLFWLSQLSEKSSFELKPNPARLIALFKSKSLDEIATAITEKIDLVDEKYVYEDLYALVEDTSYLDNFVKSFKPTIKSTIKYIVK